MSDSNSNLVPNPEMKSIRETIHGKWDNDRGLYFDGMPEHKICGEGYCVPAIISHSNNKEEEKVDGEAVYETVQDLIGYVKARVGAEKPVYRDDILNHLEIYALKHRLGSNPWEGLIPPDTTNRCSVCNQPAPYYISGHGTRITRAHDCKGYPLRDF